MTDDPTAITDGAPRFAANESSQASEQGQAAAWQQAWRTQGADQAAATTRGDFAVATRDSGGRAFMAVDRFAERTLCWRVDGGALRFARRADELADAQPELDPQALFDYLFFHCIPSPRTVFKGVQRLPPGHRGVWEGGRLDVKPYWVPAFTEPRGAVSFEALKAEFRQLMREAVARQLDGTKAAC